MRWPVVEIRTASSLNSGVQPALVVLITFHLLTDIEPLKNIYRRVLENLNAQASA